VTQERLFNFVSKLEASLPEGETKNTLMNILGGWNQIIEDAKTHDFNMNNIVIRQSVYQISGLSKRYLSLETIKAMEEAGRVGSDFKKQGYFPTQQAIDQADEAAGVALDGTKQISSTVQQKVSEVPGSSLGLPEEQHKAFTLGKKQIAGLTLGIGLSFIFSFGPKLQEYGRYYSDNFALTIGNAIQITGIGMSLASLGAMGYGAAINILQHVPISKIMMGVGRTFILGYIVSTVINIIVNIIVCFFWVPNLPSCGCKTDPAYGEKMFKLEKNGITMVKKPPVLPGQPSPIKLEELSYVYYGNLHCPELTDRNHKIVLDLISDTKSSFDLSAYLQDACTTIDGRCFECTVPIRGDFDMLGILPGEYSAYVMEHHIDGGVDMGVSFTTQKDFYLCSPDNVFDRSENKCVACDTNTHTQSNGELSGTCEEGCGASLACDELAPNRDITINCFSNREIPGGTCNIAGKPYFKDRCDSSCIAVDADNICRSAGSICAWYYNPIDGCTADVECNNRDAGTSQCIGNVNKTCGTDCKYSEICDSNCGAHPRCDGIEPGTGCCTSGCYYGNMNNDNEVNIVDVSIVALAFGTQRGDPKYNLKFDVNGDGKIDIVDISIVAIAFGKSC
jgi:hypothetical protein